MAVFTTKFQKEVKEFTLAKIKEIEAFSKEVFDLSDTFSIKPTIRFSERGKGRSWGGVKIKPGGSPVPYVSLNLSICTIGTFHEYKSFADNKHIGAVENCNWQKWVAALVAHEIAHVVQFSLVRPLYFAKDQRAFSNSTITPPSWTSGHDLFWKNIYRILRTEFVNNTEFSASAPEFAETNPVPVKKASGQKVDIIRGKYRNQQVFGIYDLVRGYKPRANSTTEGTVAVLYAGKVIRIRVKPGNFKYI